MVVLSLELLAIPPAVCAYRGSSSIHYTNIHAISHFDEDIDGFDYTYVDLHAVPGLGEEVGGVERPVVLREHLRMHRRLQ